jgi:hypothetical protein
MLKKIDKWNIEVHEESCTHGTHCTTFQPELNTTVHLAVPTLNLDHIGRVTLEGRNFRNGGPIFVTGEKPSPPPQKRSCRKYFLEVSWHCHYGTNQCVFALRS